jgi:hypothetical protein
MPPLSIAHRHDVDTRGERSESPNQFCIHPLLPPVSCLLFPASYLLLIPRLTVAEQKVKEFAAKKG